MQPMHALVVHLVTTLPLLIVLCALPLRPLKGWLVCSQYFYKAEEGRLAVTNTSSDGDAAALIAKTAAIAINNHHLHRR